jgi:hypothetical protein
MAIPDHLFVTDPARAAIELAADAAKLMNSLPPERAALKEHLREAIEHLDVVHRAIDQAPEKQLEESRRKFGQ